MDYYNIVEIGGLCLGWWWWEVLWLHFDTRKKDEDDKGNVVFGMTVFVFVVLALF